MENRTVEIGEFYRHFKGNCYMVEMLATDSETNKKVVVYRSLSDNKTWVRPLDMFLSKVDKEKYPDVNQEYRFELISKVASSQEIFEKLYNESKCRDGII